jgi:catechol 2,3-dioxygenase-like lactoylglutathione lyase family enzyme
VIEYADFTLRSVSSGKIIQPLTDDYYSHYKEASMIQSRFGHIQINIHSKNMGFYKDLFAFMGWQTLEDEPMMFGVGPDIFNSFWFFPGANEAGNDYDGAGMNHVGLLVQSQSEIDEMVTYLHERNIRPLFDTPRHRPEFAMNEEYTYYQVMFESPDRILFEIVYMGPLQKT